MKHNFQQFLFIPALAVSVILIFFPSSAMGAGKWYASTSLQFSQGNYIFENNTTTYYLYGGVRYRADAWSVFANIPLIGQNSDQVTNTGGVFFPSRHHQGEGNTGGFHHGGRMGDNGIGSNFIMGLGDIYLNGEYRIIAEDGQVPYVGGTVKLKIPTASTANHFGTGKPDYGLGFTFRKQVGGYAAFMDLGFWKIGDPEGVDYRDIHTFGVGMGRFLSGGRYGVMVYFETYSRLLNDIEPNRQFSLGFNYRVKSGVILSVIGAAGLSSSSPDISLSTGLEWAL